MHQNRNIRGPSLTEIENGDIFELSHDRVPDGQIYFATEGQRSDKSLSEIQKRQKISL